MRYLWVLVFLTLAACSTSVQTNSGNQGDADVGECWWCVDTTTPDVSVLTEETGKGNGKGESNDLSDKLGDGYLLIWSGSWSDDNEEGTMGIRLYKDSGKTLTCDISFPVATSASNDGCVECTFAWTFTLGEPTVNEEDDSCGLLDSIAKSEHSYGHGEPSGIYTTKGNDWVQIEDGYSSYTDETWEFEYTYNFGSIGDMNGNSGDDKEGLDQECYDACIAKGASEDVCNNACGGESSDEKGQSEIDEECYDGCIGKGESEENCAAACGGGGSGNEKRDESEPEAP